MLASGIGASLGARVSSQARVVCGVGLVVLAALAIRLLWLDADASRTLTWSGAPFTDEGLYSHVARNRVLWNVPRTDGWDNRLVGPLFDGLAYVVFSLFGVGYVQLRLISVLLTVAAVPLFWDMLRRDWGPWLALLAAALWSFDHFWFQYSRLGLLEPGMVALLVASAFSWRRALDGSWHWAVIGGACAGLAWVWKSLALLFVPVPIIALLLLAPPRRHWRVAVGYLVGLGLVVSMYGAAWYLPQRDAIDAYNRFYAADRVPDSIAEALRALALHTAAWRFPEARAVVAQSPVVLAAGLVGVLRALPVLLRRQLRPMMALAIAWLGCGSALLIMPYSPPRYYTLLLPPLVIVAVSLAVPHRRVEHRTRSWLVAGLLLVACGVWNGVGYGAWASHRRTSLVDASRALGALVPAGAIVLGVHACGLSLENELRCAPPFAGLANDRDPVATLGAQYAIVELGSRDDFMRHFYPDVLARSERLATFEVGSRRVAVYRLAAGGSGDARSDRP